MSVLGEAIFEVSETSAAGGRRGELSLPHGTVQTPVFMPVGTAATVKAVEQSVVEGLGAEIILANTYHLYLRPGHELIARAGGVHRFMSWERPDADGLGWVPGVFAGEAAQDYRRRRGVSVAPRWEQALLFARALDGGADRAGGRRDDGLRRVRGDAGELGANAGLDDADPCVGGAVEEVLGGASA